MNITIHRGAHRHDMTIHEEGKDTFFDLSKMTKAERNKMRRIIVGIYRNGGKRKAS